MESKRWVRGKSQICNRPFHTIAVIICALTSALVPDGEDLQEKMDDSAFTPAPSMAPIPRLKAADYLVPG